MKIYICDDEPKMLVNLWQKIKEYVPDGIVECFISGRDMLDKLQKEHCDVLFLDIDMPGISGMEVAGWLMKQEKRPLIIFVTSHDELVYDSFQYHPFGFIRKAYFDSEIKSVLDACMEELNSKVRYFHFRLESREIRVPLGDICYFEAEGNYLKLILKQGEYRLRSTLTAVENSISRQGFIRIHKGFLVNQSAIRKLGNDRVQLSDGTLLPLGKTYSDRVREQFMRCLRG